MAQTKKKRSRKRRGTPAGTVSRPAGGGRARAKDDPKQAARERRAARINREPTWQGSVKRAAIAAVVLGLFAALVLKYDARRAIPLVVFMFILYIPLGYLTDRAAYNFRRRKQG